MQQEISYPDEGNLELALSYLRESLPRRELDLFLGQARPLAQSLARFETTALDSFLSLTGTTLYQQLRRVRNAPLEAYLVFADCYELVDAPVEEKMILIKRGIREYREDQNFREDVLKLWKE